MVFWLLADTKVSIGELVNEDVGIKFGLFVEGCVAGTVGIVVAEKVVERKAVTIVVVGMLEEDVGIIVGGFVEGDSIVSSVVNKLVEKGDVGIIVGEFVVGRKVVIIAIVGKFVEG